MKERFFKKRFIIPSLFLVTILILNSFKHPFVVYLPFAIPGNQMASTIPPFGIFIESTYENENPNDPCSIITHEMVHWDQYQRMGLFSFTSNYLKVYFNSGRINNWMEDEARKPCSSKSR